MAGVEAYEADVANGRVWMMYAHDGVQHRVNLLLHEGSEIPMHSHSYAHDYVLGKGTYALTIERPDGEKREEVVSGETYGHVPAGWRHHFRLAKWGGEPGKVDCFWREK